MSKITLQLDYALAEGDAPDALNDTVYVDGGPVEIRVVNPHGPGGGNPVIAVAGNAGAVLDWLLAEYVMGSLDDALDLMKIARVAGE